MAAALEHQFHLVLCVGVPCACQTSLPFKLIRYVAVRPLPHASLATSRKAQVAGLSGFCGIQSGCALESFRCAYRAQVCRRRGPALVRRLSDLLWRSHLYTDVPPSGEAANATYLRKGPAATWRRAHLVSLSVSPFVGLAWGGGGRWRRAALRTWDGWVGGEIDCAQASRQRIQ